MQGVSHGKSTKASARWKVKKNLEKSGEDEGVGSSRALTRDEFISSVFMETDLAEWEATARANGSSNKDETEPRLLSTHH